MTPADHRRRRRRVALSPSRRRLVPSLERFAVFRLDRAAAALRDMSEEALEQEGSLRLTDVAALCVLADRVDLPQSALGERIGLDRSTAAELIVGLEEEGHVARSPHPSDGRRQVVNITRGGRAVLQAAEVSLATAEREFTAALHEDEEEQLRAILRELEPPEHALGDLYYLAPSRDRG
jgi:DNA-binding MarR family transcriptional regulator